jgi:PAS domain S-box-containing protein
MKNHRGADLSDPSGWIGAWVHCRPGRLAILGILSCMLSSSFAAAQASAKNVLVVFSFAGQTTDLEVIEPAVRQHYPGTVNLYSAYVYGNYEQMAEGPSYLDSLAETFRRGYKHVKPDVIIVAAPDALRFTTQYRDKIFPDVPIVFYGLSRDELTGIKLQPGMAGRTESSDIQATIQLALHLHSDARAVAVIEESEGLWWSIAHTELLRHRDQVEEIDLIGPPSTGEIRRINALPAHTLVLFQQLPESAVGRSLGAYDVLAVAAKRLPTYSAFHTLCLDHGCIGGVYADWNQNMAWAGETAAKILSGEKLGSDPVVEDSDRRVMVDWRQLRHWHIRESALPSGSLVLYRRPTPWELYRNYILAAVALIVLQALLIFALLWQRSRKRKAEAVLRESEERFRTLAETTPSLIWICDRQGKTTYLNERRFAYTGPGDKAGYGDSWMEYVHPDDLPTVKDDFSTALKTRHSYSSEYRLRRSDGVYRWVFNLASPRMNSDGSFAGFIGSIVDITDQKLAQQALRELSGRLIRAQEEERSRIARELHDDICQKLALLSVKVDRANHNSNESRSDLEEIKRHCSEIADDVQMLSHQLHSSKLEYLGVAEALKGFCNEFSKQHEVRIHYRESGVPEFLPRDISLVLFRIAQEALHNAVKYSQSAEFSVELSSATDQVRLEVRDWGAGFDVDEVRRNSGLGLLSMQERAHLVQGSLSVESRPGAGTSILVVVPLATDGVLNEADSLPATGTPGAPAFALDNESMGG